MTPVLSIIIPVFGEALTLPRLLAHLSQCPRIGECEIIVVDGDEGSSMTPVTALPVTVVLSEPGRGTQLNAGARVARAPRLLFLHADTRLPLRFVSLVEDALEQKAAGAFDLSIQSLHPVVRLISFSGMVRSRISRLPYGDQAHFIRKDVFLRVGRYPEEPLMEDVILMDRLKEMREQIAIIPAPARTSDRRWLSHGPVRNTLRNWRLMVSFRAGIDPRRLIARYPRQSSLNSWDTTVVVFYRALRNSGVKTRLAATIGSENALAVYSACVADLARSLTTLAAVVAPFIDDPSAGYDPFAASNVPRALSRKLIPAPGGTPQTGDSLWARMDDAFRRCFAQGAKRVVLIGSDLPGLTTEILEQASATLAAKDAVLGPTADGGFYLLGFTSTGYLPAAVRAGSTARAADVGETTRSVLQSAGRSYALVPTLSDIDTKNDLERVVRSKSSMGRNLKLTISRLHID